MKSDFLCNCTWLLYVNIKTKEEYCLNPKCKNYKDIKSLYDQHEEVEKRFNSIKGSIRLKAKVLGPNFQRCLFVQQNDLFSRMYRGEGSPIEELLKISYMISLTKNTKFIGRDNRSKTFFDFIDSKKEEIETYLFYQDMKEENWVLADFQEKPKFPLQLKYMEEVNSQKNNYGLVNDIKSPKNFRYNSFDLQEIDKKAFKIGMNNLEEYFLQFFPEMIKLDMLTKSNQEFSKMFYRDINKHYIAAMFSLFFSSKEYNELSRISKKNFSKTLKEMDFDNSLIQEFFQFLKGTGEQIPLAIVDNENIIYGKWTLFSMILKYMGTLKDYPAIPMGKGIASFVFEKEIRVFFKDKKYIVPFNKGFKLTKNSLENDIIIIDKKGKKIIIIEAKYRDLPSSAFSAKNLKKIKLSDMEFGELAIIKRQLERKKEIEEKIDIFKQRCLKKN